LSGQPYVDVQIHAQWKDEHSRSWAVTCDLSEQVTADDVLQRVKKFNLEKEETIKTITEKLNPDDDMAMTSLKVSLQCPVGQIRMSTPVRTKQCSHLQVN
jgi:E3 SUMO-protein ligase PIAS1